MCCRFQCPAVLPGASRFLLLTPVASRPGRSSIMSRIESVLKQAAELRAVGHPWEEVAQKLHRKVKTCLNWPSAYPSLWKTLYRAAQERRFDQTANECHTYL